MMEPISYQQFGHEFIHRVVTPDRIRRELKKLLAEPIQGGLTILPPELITARYTFNLREVGVETRAELLPNLGLRQRISGSLALSLRVLGMPFSFTLGVGIRLEQLVRAYPPLVLKLETRPIDHASVEISVDAHGMPSEILDRLKLIEGSVRSEVVAQVNKRLSSGPIAAALAIDIQRFAEATPLARQILAQPSGDGAAPTPQAAPA